MSIVGRTYLEKGERVVVLVQWGLASRGETHGGPRNVLIRRSDGSLIVRPFRGLRVDPERLDRPAGQERSESGILDGTRHAAVVSDAAGGETSHTPT